MCDLRDRFRGCLLGGMLGDVIGAVVEAESPQYIRNRFGSIEDILATESAPEFSGEPWKVGRFTDDTQMPLCVADWLIEDEPRSAERLLDRFSRACEPWRRYVPGTAAILRLYPHHKHEWRELATSMFPHGSLGNGSAMRAAPVGLACVRDLGAVTSMAIESSRPTHSHPSAYQGAVLQALAVAMAAGASTADPSAFIAAMRAGLFYFADLLQDTDPFARALDAIEEGIEKGACCQEMSDTLGTGITAHESVPMAVYCFLRHPDSYGDVVREAVFAGGDTNTIACMAGGISGAFLGASAIPAHWLGAIREETFTVPYVSGTADRLYDKYAG